MAGKKFRFSLERVLKLRMHETEQARQRLAHARRKCSAQEKRVATALNKQQELSLKAPGSGSVDTTVVEEEIPAMTSEISDDEYSRTL